VQLRFFCYWISRRWTVDDLGREVGLSRSALADRFIRLIGVPPMHYLANWRMQVATQRLRDTSASIAQVAEAIGYDSEAAFSRAFKKAFGTAPGSWRRSNSSPISRAKPSTDWFGPRRLTGTTYIGSLHSASVRCGAQFRKHYREASEAYDPTRSYPVDVPQES
jgi:AraC-like DNA-binding protein